MNKLITAMVMVLLPMANVAHADVLYFDDISTSVTVNAVVPNGYGGLNWSNVKVVHKDHPNAVWGYENGLVSGDYVAFNPWSNASTVYAGNFNFIGAYLTAAWREGLNINLKGYSNSALVYDQTVIVDPYASTWFEFNFNNIDELVFDSFGGVDADPSDSGNGENFVMDNFTYVIPEPATLGLIGLVTGGIYFARRFFIA